MTKGGGNTNLLFALGMDFCSSLLSPFNAADGRVMAWNKRVRWDETEWLWTEDCGLVLPHDTNAILERMRKTLQIKPMCTGQATAVQSRCFWSVRCLDQTVWALLYLHCWSDPKTCTAAFSTYVSSRESLKVYQQSRQAWTSLAGQRFDSIKLIQVIASYLLN